MAHKCAFCSTAKLVEPFSVWYKVDSETWDTRDVIWLCNKCKLEVRDMSGAILEENLFSYYAMHIRDFHYYKKRLTEKYRGGEQWIT